MESVFLMKARTISKKQLAIALDLITANNYILRKRLRRFFMTDSFIQAKLNLTIAAYNKIRVFDAEQTRIITTEFEINDHEF